jgi:hypothetical protein
VLAWTPLLAQLSPGDLSKPHAEYEGITNCVNCHEIGKKLQFSNCLNCHTLLKERIDQGKGLHARVDHQKCTDCHHDHQGVDYEMIIWEDGQDNFDHSLTGYKLEGKHKPVKCRDCHKAEYISSPQRLLDKKKKLDRTFLGLDQKCLSCHNDEHRGQMKDDCLSCHNMEGWKPAPGFDHNKTKYPLTGLHAKVKCEDCHKKVTDNKYPKDADYLTYKLEKFDACTDCHKDVHNNRFGADCTKCHTTAGWKEYNNKQFNHDRTRYPLKGKHVKVDCEKCHLPGKPLAPLAFNACLDCHKDIHFGQFADRKQKGACEECHTVDRFVPSDFTVNIHNTSSSYKLEGAHLAVPCFICHKKVDIGRSDERMQFTFKQTRCSDCHEDVHKGEVDKYKKKDGCESCHNVASWKKVKFDHADTKFPLEGRHKTTECSACHKPLDVGTKKERYQFLNLALDCLSCHEDIHVGQFAEVGGSVKCEKCHTPDSWFAEKFDHNRDSKYKIDGAHASVKCDGCHKTENIGGKQAVRYKPIGTECSTCHKGSEILQRL